MAQALYSSDFYRTFCQRLSKRGVMAVNLWSGDKKYFSMASKAFKEGSDNNYVQMAVKKKSNTIFMAFADQIPKSTLRKVRKKAMQYQKQYQLPFHTYLKKMRRTNKLVDFFQGVSR
jgi:spermidine synthase